MPGLRPLPLALALALLPATVLAQETAPPAPTPGLRAYAGYVRLRGEGGATDGNGVVAGIQGHFWPANVFSPYWGAQLLAVSLSEGILPVLNGEVGLRVMPWPTAAVRPYLRASGGISFVLILPFPNAALSAGVAVPVGGWVFDLGVTGRRGFNLVNPPNVTDEVSIQLGLGF